jgi:hypothetical protein
MTNKWGLWGTSRPPPKPGEPSLLAKAMVRPLGQPYDFIQWALFVLLWLLYMWADEGSKPLAESFLSWFLSRFFVLFGGFIVSLISAVITGVSRLVHALSALWHRQPAPVPASMPPVPPEAENWPQHAHYSLQEYARDRELARRER